MTCSRLTPQLTNRILLGACCIVVQVLSLTLAPALAVAATAANSEALPVLKIGQFSSAKERQIFKDWQPYTFEAIKSHSEYQLVTEDNKRVLRADSRAAASGLTRRVNIDLQQYPILSWRWKVSERPTARDDSKRSEDDHAARIYLIFNSPDANESNWSWLWRQMSFNQTRSSHAINYIWAHSARPETRISSPYTTSSMMIAVNSGDEGIGDWISLERNVLEDYQASFGGTPPRLSAIAIMTDTDDTQSRATAFYGDIEFSALPSQHP